MAFRFNLIDDLSVGTHPDTWAPWKCNGTDRGITVYGDGRVLFLKADLRDVLRELGQGKDNAKAYLREHPEVAGEIEAAPRAKLLPGKRGASE